jgi:hypothetical protein
MNAIVGVPVAQRGERLKTRQDGVRRNAWGISVRVCSGCWCCDGVYGNRNGWDGRQGRLGIENTEVRY